MPNTRLARNIWPQRAVLQTCYSRNISLGPTPYTYVGMFFDHPRNVFCTSFVHLMCDVLTFNHWIFRKLNVRVNKIKSMSISTVDNICLINTQICMTNHTDL